MGNELQIGISNEHLQTLAQAGVIPHNTPEAILRVFAESCKLHGLSPFKKEIYLVSYQTRDNGAKYSTIVGIDGMRTKAARTGQFAGRDDCKFDVQPDGSYKTAANLKSENKLPQTATVTVYRAISGMRCPFTKTVVFSEYCPENTNRNPKWASMPFNMIDKCAEAAALRMAFADETAGLNVEEEIAAIKDVTIEAAKNAPSVKIDTDILEDKIADCKTVDDLNTLYRSNKAYAEFAPMFAARKEAILDELQRAGKI